MLTFERRWQLRNWKGPIQYEDKSTKSLMMLTTDMALTTDKSFRQWSQKYAKDQEAFFSDFANVFKKVCSRFRTPETSLMVVQLLENGVPEKNFSTTFRFKTIEEQQDAAKASA